MRALLLALPLAILSLCPSSGNADDARPRQIAGVSDTEKTQEVIINPDHERYRGYYLDLSQIAAHPSFSVMANALRHQGLDPLAQQFPVVIAKNCLSVAVD